MTLPPLNLNDSSAATSGAYGGGQGSNGGGVYFNNNQGQKNGIGATELSIFAIVALLIVFMVVEK